MEQPKVSIIIPIYNRANLIGETLDSLLTQTYKNWECILVDDHSTDNSVEVVQKYCETDKRFKLFRRPENKPKGANACRNYGFEKSLGEYIQWFDSDDIFTATAIEKKLNSSKTHYGSICTFNVFSNEEKFSINFKCLPKVIAFPVYEYFLGNLKMLTLNVFFSRKFLEKLPLLYDEKLQRAQEMEFYFRIRDLFINIPFINEPLIFKRKHENSIEGKVKKKDTRLINDELSVYLKITKTPVTQFKKNGREIKLKFLSKYIHLINKFDHSQYLKKIRYLLAIFYQQLPLFEKMKIIFFSIMDIFFRRGKYKVKKILKNVQH